MLADRGAAPGGRRNALAAKARNDGIEIPSALAEVLEKLAS
jgi:hypothetical protein